MSPSPGSTKAVELTTQIKVAKLHDLGFPTSKAKDIQCWSKLFGDILLL